MTNDTQQRVFSILRQVLALASVVMGVLTASVTTLHLPPVVSSVLVVAGGIILAVEHYVGDPSTGTPVPPTTSDVAKAQAVIDSFSRSTQGNPVQH